MNKFLVLSAIAGLGYGLFKFVKNHNKTLNMPKMNEHKNEAVQA